MLYSPSWERVKWSGRDTSLWPLYNVRRPQTTINTNYDNNLHYSEKHSSKNASALSLSSLSEKLKIEGRLYESFKMENEDNDTILLNWYFTTFKANFYNIERIRDQDMMSIWIRIGMVMVMIRCQDESSRKKMKVVDGWWCGCEWWWWW